MQQTFFIIEIVDAIETKSKTDIGDYSSVTETSACILQVPAPGDEAKGINPEILNFFAHRIYIDFCVYFFTGFYYKNPLSRGLEISPYFYRIKIKCYGL
ncbi:MAG: hypothetical protein IPK57_04150 [Chitinophagaceae bacterium]|nr:hypothetical protein [Chitinophagaceae bacterium]